MENENRVCEGTVNGETIPAATTDAVFNPPQEAVPQQQVYAPVEIRCVNCQGLLEPNQAFCPECGHPVGAPQNINAGFSHPGVAVEQKKSKKKIVLPIVLGGVATLIILAIALFVILTNPQRYIEKGNYETAYDVASSDEKEGILRENMVAVVSAMCVDSLKDPESFELRNAWVRVTDSDKEIVLEVAANNTYGNTIINYWYYTWDDDDCTFELYENFADFDEDTIYSWDDYSERIDKLLKNLARRFAQIVISDGVQLDQESVDNINMLFNNDILNLVELVSVEPTLTE